MKKEDEKYVQFPLFLIREMFIDKKEAIEKIFNYGIYNYSTKYHYQKREVAKQLIYDNYRGNLSTILEFQIKALESDIIGIDECAVFDNKGEYDPSFELFELERIFSVNDELYKNAVEHYQMHMAFKSLGITGNIEQTIKSAKEIERQLPEHEPMPMISKTHLFNFRDNVKSEIEIAQFVAYIALRSIIGGKRQYAKTNKLHIVSRMFGYASHKHLPKKLTPAIKELLKKYSHRYHIDKVLQHLELNWNVLTYSNNIRGMYVAMENKISIDALALAAETKKQKNRINELKNAKAKAKEKALQQLNKGQQLNKVTA